MKILQYRPSRETAYVIHAVFFNFYLLLLVRAIAVFYALCPTYDAPRGWCSQLRRVKRFTDVIFLAIGFESFDVYGTPEPFDWISFTFTFSFPFLALITIHRGMFMDTEPKPAESWMDKTLKLCRTVYFVLGSFLLIAMLLRMGIDFYQQLHKSEMILIDASKIRALPPK